MEKARLTTIALLTRVVNLAESNYRNLGMRNVAGVDLAQQAKMYESHDAAFRELLAARNELREALIPTELRGKV
jgi:hypothetical protein